MGLWGHVNCARSALGCHEWPSGAVAGAEKAQEVAQETSWEVGAAVKCEKITCKDFFYLQWLRHPCDFSFTEIKRGKMGVQCKLAAKATPCAAGRQAVARPSLCCCLAPSRGQEDRKYFVLSACCEAHRLEGRKAGAAPLPLICM